MKALGCQPVESTSLSKFWFQIVNLHPYTAAAVLPESGDGGGGDDDDGETITRGSDGDGGGAGHVIISTLQKFPRLREDGLPRALAVRRCRLTPPSG